LSAGLAAGLKLYQPDGHGGIANLKLAVEQNGVLRYAGAVGTGFSDATIRMLRKVLDPLAQNRSAVASLKVKGAVWVRPELHAEICLSRLHDRRRIAPRII
jgi:ATP-dependent DNA ligase